MSPSTAWRHRHARLTRRPPSLSRVSCGGRCRVGDSNLVPAWESSMPFVRYLVLLFALTLLAAQGHAQNGPIKIEKFNHSAWTKGIFSEAVTVTGIGNAKFVYLAGVGAEDENGPRGNVRHHGSFLDQCRYAYDKIKRVLAHHGAKLSDVVKVTTYITDLRHRVTLGKCVGEAWGDITFPTNTLIGVSALAFPEMIIEVDVTAIIAK
ncbi:MAG: hypothetical protein GEU91_15885 [Rhizobiales bacterium]|nr:hypothetical protein [Hyphomicrobiales bacterium]